MNASSRITPRDARVLVVDDDEQLLRVVTRILEEAGYSCAVATGASEARRLMTKASFELVLTDMTMGSESGLELLRHVRSEFPDTATLMVTGSDNPELAEAVLDVGAYGYMIKPVTRTELLVDVSNALRRRSLELDARDRRHRLEEMVRARTVELWSALQEVESRERQLRTSRYETIERLSIAAEFRDVETAAHIHRMSSYCGLLARWTGFDREQCEQIQTASVMHDVGKIGVPDAVLLKPGRLSSGEFDLMKRHAEFGYEILKGTTSSLLDLAAEIALTHHERWDGRGYPRGLAADEIPLEGRIAALADVFDALTNDRIYRRAFPIPRAVEMIKEERGRQFDPELLDLFLDRFGDVLRVKETVERGRGA